MNTLSEYIAAISSRGDQYGGHRGVLDFLAWCGKFGTHSVTLEEARRFYNDPQSSYADSFEKERTFTIE